MKRTQVLTGLIIMQVLWLLGCGMNSKGPSVAKAGEVPAEKLEGLSVVTGKTTDHGAVVMFFPMNIPEGWEGMLVKRRPLDKPHTPWELLNKTPIYPKGFSNSYLDAVVSVSTQESRLQKKFETVKKTKKLGIMDLDAVAAPPTQDGLRSTCFLNIYIATFDADFALFFGFGYLDAEANRTDKRYVYGVFPVFNGKMTPEPVGVWNDHVPRDSEELKVKNVTFEKQIGGEYLIKWSVEKEIVDKYQIFELNLLKSVPGKEQQFIRLSRKDPRKKKPIDGRYQMEVNDTPSEGTVYKIVLVHWMGWKYETETIVPFKAEE